ncbi:hypothetical protein R1flu_020704 [Riccia fluitans]|uniref:Uncharacterized protein n=1 Tax=Riccia fluitans TaxID=41844 RepID=A0ABD1ZM95_9MARC
MEWEATQRDKLQEDLDRVKRQLKLQETELLLLQEEKEHMTAEASHLRMQRTSTHRSVSIQSFAARVSRPRETDNEDSPSQPPLQHRRIDPPDVLALEPAPASSVTLMLAPPADPSTRPE